MPHTIELKRADLELLGEAMDASLAAKQKKLQAHNYREAVRQFEDAVEKLMRPVFVAKAHNNIFVWLQDQFAHSGRQFQESKLGKDAWDICRRCANGEYNKEPPTPDHPLFKF